MDLAFKAGITESFFTLQNKDIFVIDSSSIGVFTSSMISSEMSPIYNDTVYMTGSYLITSELIPKTTISESGSFFLVK